MRRILPILFVVSIAGACTALTKDAHEQCLSFGFKAQTSGYAECRLELEMEKRTADRGVMSFLPVLISAGAMVASAN